MIAPSTLRSRIGMLQAHQTTLYSIVHYTSHHPAVEAALMDGNLPVFSTVCLNKNSLRITCQMLFDMSLGSYHKRTTQETAQSF